MVATAHKRDESDVSPQHLFLTLAVHGWSYRQIALELGK
jgi:hypothetical protein